MAALVQISNGNDPRASTRTAPLTCLAGCFRSTIATVASTYVRACVRTRSRCYDAAMVIISESVNMNTHTVAICARQSVAVMVCCELVSEGTKKTLPIEPSCVAKEQSSVCARAQLQ